MTVKLSSRGPHRPAAIHPPIGLFGGRFDPVHRAHLAIAKAVADQLNLTEIRWIVSGEAEHKAVAAPASDRAEMVRLALAAMHDSRMHSDDREIKAKAAGQSNYTADTLMGLQQEFPAKKFIWILGEDQLQDFTSWSRWQWLITQMEFAVCGRPGAQGSPAAQALQQQGAMVYWIETTPDHVSSTQIREAIAAGQPIADLVPAPVADYILKHHLYR